jgi:hypothetical protein
MPLNIVKLCVGAESVEDLEAWIRERLLMMAVAGEKPEQTHTTRMMPKRAAEIAGSGSLYWVIKGFVQARQLITDIRQFKDVDGIERCDLVLEPVVVRTQMQPKRPFQGWRYLEDKDAPRDIRHGVVEGEIDPQMRKALAELALL